MEKTNRVIVLHEDTKTGGIAGEVAAIINEECFDALDAPIARIASADTPVPFSPPLEEAFLPKVEDVVREARRLRRLLAGPFGATSLLRRTSLFLTLALWP